MYRVIKWITYQRTGYENTTNKPDKKRLKELWNETECNWPKNIKKTKTARKRLSCWKGACIMYLVWYIYIYIYDIYMTAATPTRERLEEGRMERREEKKGKSPKKHTHTRCSNSSKNLVYLVLIAFSLGYRVEPGTLPHLPFLLSSTAVPSVNCNCATTAAVAPLINKSTKTKRSYVMYPIINSILILILCWRIRDCGSTGSTINTYEFVSCLVEPVPSLRSAIPCLHFLFSVPDTRVYRLTSLVS